MAISLTANALPASATLAINGNLTYSVEGDGVDSSYDAIFGDNLWTYWGSFDFSASMTGTPPAFSENANWYLSGEGGYQYGWINNETQESGGNSDSGSFGPTYLGYWSADDLFGPAITDYSDILPAIGMALSSTPTLTEVIVAINDILDPSLAFGSLPSQITDISDYIWVSLSGNTVSYVSTLGLTIDGVDPTDAKMSFGGSLTLQAVPEPGTLGLLGLGLIGIVLVRRRRKVA